MIITSLCTFEFGLLAFLLHSEGGTVNKWPHLLGGKRKPNRHTGLGTGGGEPRQERDVATEGRSRDSHALGDTGERDDAAHVLAGRGGQGAECTPIALLQEPGAPRGQGRRAHRPAAGPLTRRSPQASEPRGLLCARGCPHSCRHPGQPQYSLGSPGEGALPIHQKTDLDIKIECVFGKRSMCCQKERGPGSPGEPGFHWGRGGGDPGALGGAARLWLFQGTLPVTVVCCV